MAHRVSVRNQQTKSQDRVVPGGTDFRAERQAQEEKNWERQPFYLLTSALMGDPNDHLPTIPMLPQGGAHFERQIGMDRVAAETSTHLLQQEKWAEPAGKRF